MCAMRDTKQWNYIEILQSITYLLREAFKNKNDETYGIFHMLVDPPPPYQHMENSFVIFLLSKKDF